MVKEKSAERSRLRIGVSAAACALTLLVSALVAAGWLDLGVKGEWVWKHLPPRSAADLWFPFLVFLVFLCCVKEFLSSRRETFVLAVLFVFSFFFHVCTSWAGRLQLEEYILVTITPMMSGFYSESLEIDSVRDFLGNYQALARDFNFHAKGYPPGPILYFWSVNKFFRAFPEAAVWLLDMVRGTIFDPGEGFFVLSERFSQENVAMPLKAGVLVSSWMIPLISGLTIFPVYYLTRSLSDRRTAFFAAALYPVFPASSLFAPGFDLVFPVFALLALHLFYRGLVKGGWRYGLCSGLVLGAGLFFSLAMLAVIALLCVSAGVLFFYKKTSVHGGTEQPVVVTAGSGVRNALFMAGGVIIAFTVCRALLGVNMLGVIWECWRNTSTFHSSYGLSYHWWVMYNLADFFLFTGVTVSVFFAVKAAGTVDKMRASRGGAGLSDVLSVSFVITLLLLDVSGQVLGETARLWIFLMPVVMIMAAQGISAVADRRGYLFIAVLCCQFIQTLVFKLFLDVHTV